MGSRCRQRCVKSRQLGENEAGKGGVSSDMPILYLAEMPGVEFLLWTGFAFARILFEVVWLRSF